RILFIVFLFPVILFSQEKMEGIVVEINDQNKSFALPAANVYCLDTTVGTTTDIDVKFSISYREDYSQLVIRYVGFKPDTITVKSPKFIKHALQSTSELDEVTVTSRQKTTYKSYLQATNVSTVSSAELLKAACCNLSESFETNPSIDVNFADAVTGTRQI